MKKCSDDAEVARIDVVNNAPRSLWGSFVALLTSRDALWMTMLMACLIQFSSAWIWSGAVQEAGEDALTGGGRPYAYAFQTSLWFVIVGALSVHIHRRGIDSVWNVVRPFAAMLSIGLLAAAFGASPFSSFRLLALWSLTVFGALVVGGRISGQGGLNALLSCFMIILSVSLLLVFLQGGADSGAPGLTGAGWSGAFTNKNAFGWISAVALICSLAAVRFDYWRLPVLVAAVASVCLIGSQSRASLVAALGAIPFILMSKFVLSHLSRPFAVGVQLGYLILLAMVGQVVMPYVLELLGKDATFTGRTEIWEVYLRSIMETPWLGQGPGAYTGVTAITDKLLAQLGHLGYIYTPHNMYLGAMGDSGVLGLIVFVGTLIYISFVAPLQYRGAWAPMAASVGFLVMAAGLAETREIYSSGLGIFIMVFLRAAALASMSESNERGTNEL